MALMFLLSGLFVWPSLERKGGARFLRDRVLRLGVPFAVAAGILMPLAYYAANWQFILEYGERAIEIGMRITGLQKAATLAAELGPEEALKRGLGAAAASFAQQGDVAFDLKSAVSATIGMTAACVGTYATCFDAEAVRRIAHAASSSEPMKAASVGV